MPAVDVCGGRNFKRGLTMVNFWILKNTQLDNSYTNTIDFDNIGQQAAYFNGLINNELETPQFNFIKSTFEIKVNLNYFALINANYCMFDSYINTTNKRFYAFILRVEYVNTNTTKLFIEIDVIQSYMFEYSFYDCYIDREHRDRFINNNINYSYTDEALNYGKEYEATAPVELIEPASEFPTGAPHDTVRQALFYVMIKSKSPLDSLSTVQPTQENGVNTNIYCYYVPVIMEDNTGASEYKIQFRSKLGENFSYWRCATRYDIVEISENPNILSISYSRYPICAISVTYDSVNKLYTFIIDDDHPNIIWNSYYKAYDSETAPRYVLSIYGFINTGLKIYTNDNTAQATPPTAAAIANPPTQDNEIKLKQNPYKYYSIQYGDEFFNFSNDEIHTDGFILKLFQSMGMNNAAILKVIGINGKYENVLKHKTVILNFEMPLRTDAWKNYMQTHKETLRTGALVKIGTTAAQIAGGAVTGAFGLAQGVSGAISTAASILNDNIKYEDIKQTPDDIKQTNGDLAAQNLLTGLYFRFIEFNIRPQFKQKLFIFFMRYGYKSGEFKTPDTRSRVIYNYIKMLECNINSDLNNEILNKLNSIYLQGVTLWHYRATYPENYIFQMYNYNNENIERGLIT